MLCDDLAQLLFPRVQHTPSEAMQASVRLVLQMLVRGIESGLGVEQNDAVPRSWDILCRSGLLREPALLEFALARIAEEHISRRVNEGRPDIFRQIAVEMLDSKDSSLAQSARNLLVAENSLELHTPERLIDQMPAELLHLLLWRVVAVFQSASAGDARAYVDAGNILLSRHDESRTLNAAAAKLVYFLPDDKRAKLADPVLAGLSLYASGLAQEFRISHDRVLRFIDEDSVAPFLVLLRARDCDAATAMSIVQYLRGPRADDYRLPELLEQFAVLKTEEARSAILRCRLGAETNARHG